MANLTQELLALEIRVRGGREAQRELKRIAATTKQTAKDTEKANAKAESSFTKVRKSVARVRNITLLTAFAISATAVAIDRLAKKAEKLSAVSRGFETLTARVNESSTAVLDGMRRASQGFVTDAELMKQANNALILGLPVTAKSMESLTASATKLGRALGVDTTRAIESIVTGIGRQSRLMLDNIGIIANFRLAHLRTAAALGKEVEALTAAEIKTSDWNHVTELAAQKSALLVDEVVNLSDRYLTLATRIKNTGNEFLQFINKIGSGDLKNELNLLFLEREFLVAGQEFSTGFGFFQLDREKDIAAIDNKIRALQREIEEEQAASAMRQKLAAATDAATERAQAAEVALLETQAQRRGVLEKLADAQRDLNELMLANAEQTFGGDALTGGGFLGADLPIAAPEGDFGPQIDLNTEALANMSQEFALLGMAIDGAAESWQNYNDQQESLFERAERNAAALELLAGGFAQAGAAMLGAALAGEKSTVSFKKVLQQLGQSALAQALYELAIGAAATTPWGAALYGPAPPHFKAAATFGLAGAALSVVSRGVSGGSGGGAANGIDVPTSPLPIAAQQGPLDIHVFLEGEGYFQISPEELAQQIGEEYARQAGRGGIPLGVGSDG